MMYHTQILNGVFMLIFVSSRIQNGYVDANLNLRSFSDRLRFKRDASPETETPPPDQLTLTTPPTDIEVENFRAVGLTPPTEVENFRTIALNLHNEHRKNHGAPPVALDPQLNEEAQSWADHIINTKSKLQLKQSPNYIQNMYELNSGKGKNFSDIVKKAIASWYGGKAKYKPESPGTTYGPFTVMVWKATENIGVGVATDNGRYVVVGCYSPPGNKFNSGSDKDRFFRENVQL